MCRRNFLLAMVCLVCAVTSYAQDTTSAAQRVETLRAQLGEAQAKEAELQARMQQLDEALRPENIERSLALVGSTRPEELREQRRRQLEAEKKGVQAQLDQLAQSRLRLESAIQTAEAQIYHQSAEVNSSAQQISQPPRAIEQKPAAKRRPRARRRSRRAPKS